MRTVKMNGRIFKQGDMVTLNDKAASHINGPAGLRVQLYSIDSDGNQIGLYSPDKRIDSWGDLHGHVSSFRGWYVSVTELAMIIEQDDAPYEIAKAITYRGKELKGMTCRLVAALDKHLMFVELEEHVDGCSADGLGKTGHCVAVPSNSVKRIKKSEKKSKQAK